MPSSSFSCLFLKKYYNRDFHNHSISETLLFDPALTLWQAERHFCPYRLTGAATILSFGHSLFTSLDSIGSAVGKRPIGYAIATSECPTEY